VLSPELLQSLKTYTSERTQLPLIRCRICDRRPAHWGLLEATQSWAVVIPAIWQPPRIASPIPFMSLKTPRSLPTDSPYRITDGQPLLNVRSGRSVLRAQIVRVFDVRSDVAIGISQVFAKRIRNQNVESVREPLVEQGFGSMIHGMELSVVQ